MDPAFAAVAYYEGGEMGVQLAGSRDVYAN